MDQSWGPKLNKGLWKTKSIYLFICVRVLQEESQYITECSFMWLKMYKNKLERCKKLKDAMCIHKMNFNSKSKGRFSIVNSAQYGGGCHSCTV